MQKPPTSSWNGSDVEELSCTTSTLPRRIRHISSIQVRNLTPFPVRDTVTSALTKPSEQPQFTPYGHLSDDLDVTIGRKRGRRVSNASSIHSGPRGDEDGTYGNLDQYGEPTMRRRTSSRASIPLSVSSGSSSPNLTRRPSAVGMSSTIRPTHRPRTLSSQSHQVAPSLSGDFTTSTSSVFSGILRDTSQTSLEKIVHSRLVETFITITLLSSTSNTDVHHAFNSPASRSSSPSRLVKDQSTVKSSGKSTQRRSTLGSSSLSARAHSPTTPTRHTPSASVSSGKGPLSLREKSGSVSSPNGKNSTLSSTPPSQKARFPTPSTSLGSPSPSSPTSDPAADTLPVPDYISPIHWPSTNPVFQLSRYDFAPGTDLSGTKLRVEIWGHTYQDSQSKFRQSSIMSQTPSRLADAKRKGKERQSEEAAAGSEWKVLDSWEVVLNKLKPLPEEFASNPAHIPFNTLLITLSTGETLFVPRSSSIRSGPNSRSPSPNAGYNSDPEADGYRTRASGEIGLQSPKLDAGLDSMPTSPTISELDGTHRKKRMVKSATLADLLKLTNLQAVIMDTERSLHEIVRQIDRDVVHNEANILAREVSRRQAWVVELEEERAKIHRDSELLRERISDKREELRRRREQLEWAQQLHDEDLAEGEVIEDAISEERSRLKSLRGLLPILRSNLISVVSFIYPIELVSPPDLLFSILDIPLPIPVAATDPAPPLALAAYKDVTEDSVATALGYSAQVVQLLSAYMGHRLVYPVTCVGSRSMIKDGISAMVGPRNFPLFSKGVDTYRFEYGVFLLNKDIELLMSERNLRALDMRHTLPNLKNLLLTLTDNVQRNVPGHRVTSSSLSISSLQSQSPVPAISSLAADAKQGAAVSGQAQEEGDKDGGASDSSVPVAASTSESGSAAGPSTSSMTSTPPASGTTTPTKTAQQRKSRTFLDLAPLTGFLTLRGRYGASQKPSVKAVEETPDAEGQASGNGNAAPSEAGEEAEEGDDEDDRRTIRGVGAGGTVLGNGEEELGDVVEGKTTPGVKGDGDGHGHGHGHGRHAAKGRAGNGREKMSDDAMARSPPMVLSS